MGATVARGAGRTGKGSPDFAAVMSHMPLAPPQPKLRISLISSSGAYDPRIHAPFAASSIVGDPSHRVMSVDTPSDSLRFAHEHFDHLHARSDLECIIPRQSLRAFGLELSAQLITWTGYLLHWPTFIEATVPQIVTQVQLDGGNAALIVPI